MRRALFLIGLLIEVALVFLIFLPYMLIVANGQTVTLKTIPVDPRSIFRGDYVVLSYEIGQDYDGPSVTGEEYGYGVMRVYAILENQGDAHERVGFGTSVPKLEDGQACIQGEATYTAWGPDERRHVTVRFPDIEQFFVEEGVGRELEQARNGRRLYVDVATTKSCKAVIKGVRVGEEVTPDVEVNERPIPFDIR